MKVKKLANKVLHKSAATALNAGKAAFALEMGDYRGVNEQLLNTAAVWGGKNNILSRGEAKLDKTLSKNRFYRVGKAAANIYFD